jgi:hypothetical protein
MPEVWHGIAGHRAQWHRTSLSRARRNLLGQRGPFRGGGLGAGAKATTARPRAGLSGLPARRSISLGLRVLAIKPAGTTDSLRVARLPGPLQRVGRKRQALSTPSPGEPDQRPACRYLSLKFQTIQSCSPVRYPITTAVQPWCEQESAYTLFRNLTKPVAPCIVGLACCRSLRFCEITFFPSNSHYCRADGDAPV